MLCYTCEDALLATFPKLCPFLTNFDGRVFLEATVVIDLVVWNVQCLNLESEKQLSSVIAAVKFF